MANITATDVSTTQTTSAAVEDVVTFPSSAVTYEVTNHSNNAGTAGDILWVRFSGATAASVQGAGCVPVFPGQSVQRDTGRATVVRLIATNAVLYTVEQVEQ